MRIPGCSLGLGWTVLAILWSLTGRSQTPCVNGSAGPYGCKDVDLMAVLSPADLGVGGTSKWVNDCWGWVDPLTEREYALVGAKDGTVFVDITDPIVPVRIGTLPTHTSNSVWRDIKVYADHAYIVSEASAHGLQVFDLKRLRNVATPPVTFTADAHSALFGNAHNIVIDENAAMAYVVGSSQCSGGLYMYDIAAPQNPVLAGCYDLDGYIHDAQCVSYQGPDPDHQGKRICFNCHSGTPDKLTIVDVTDPTDAEQVATMNWPNARIGHQGWLTEDHRYFLLGDEGDENFYGNDTRTLVFDVSDLDAPVLLGEHLGSKASTDHNMYMHQGYVHQANYSAGLQIMDTVDLPNAVLAEVGWFDTYTPNNAAGFDGAWSVYPYFPSGNVIITDYDFGLFIVRPRAYADIRVLLDGPLDAGTGLMNDGSRQSGLIPLVEPYSALGYSLPGGGGETTDASVLQQTGPDAIVDWVVVELRSVANPADVLAARCALLQRDGDVVDTDGSSLPAFDIAMGNYHASVRHRNHLGAMSQGLVRIGLAPSRVDLSDGSTPTFGTDAQKSVGPYRALWSGNTVGDAQVKYAGSNNDRDKILQAIGGSIPTATVVGYRLEDVDLNGVTQYAGSGNDRDRILQNIGGSIPTAIRNEQLP